MIWTSIISPGMQMHASYTNLRNQFNLLGYLFWRSAGWGRMATVYFCLCCSFSGDFSYFRFMVAIPLGLLVVDMWSRRRPGGAMTVHARA